MTAEMAVELDGLITFFASHHAIRGEKVLGEAGLDIELVPGPKELSPSCGVALRIHFAERENARVHLDEKKVQVDEIIRYRPRTDDWEDPQARRGWRHLFTRRGNQ